MANNILIKDGNNVSVMVHSIEDGTSTHWHQTVISDTSGHVNSFVSGSQAAQAGMQGLVVALHPSSPLPAGLLHIGRVSVFSDATPSNVSIQDRAAVSVLNQVSIAPQTLNIAGAVSVLDRVSVQGRVSVDNLVAVSINGPLPAGTLHLGKVSVEGLTITAGGGLVVSVGGAVSVQAVPMGGSDGTNVRRVLTDVEGAVKIGSFTTTPEYNFGRPADTNVYAVGDLVANNTAAGSVIPLSFPVSRLTGGGGSLMVRRARLVTPGDNRTTERSYRLHLWNVASGLSVTNGDNGVFAPTQVSNYLGAIDIPMYLSAATGAAGIGAPVAGADINIQLAASQVSISGLLEARTSINPANAADYRVTLELCHD